MMIMMMDLTRQLLLPKADGFVSHFIKYSAKDLDSEVEIKCD